MFIRHMCFEACYSGKQANGKYTKKCIRPSWITENNGRFSSDFFFRFWR